MKVVNKYMFPVVYHNVLNVMLCLHKDKVCTDMSDISISVKYPCRQCDYKATQKSNLKTHIESTHEGVKFQCNQCDYKATKQSNLKMHIESVHKGVKYPCCQCDYKATKQSNLKNHIKSVQFFVLLKDTCDLKTSTLDLNRSRHIFSLDLYRAIRYFVEYAYGRQVYCRRLSC